MAQIKDAEERMKNLRNAAVALAVIPLVNNIDESLDKEWNKETFDATDRAMNQFVDQLADLGFNIVPTISAEEVFERTGEALGIVKTGLFAPDVSGPVQ